ncbi:PH domain-containing protein [Bacillus sp. PS06]|uniref:PH domain-containing protein n=1 Tax=Bacillus sp. PS06 TaxID=2764176 RepID=UPI00177DAC08|nr:PH domain-containing protein [Bacillus sp. PS06]MBD8069676.1 PH domain-containing protein [Bacillus sp. PS06]
MFSAKRMHPFAAIITFFQRIRELLIPFVFLFFFSGRGSSPLAELLQIIGIILLLVGLLIAGFLHWYRFTYRVEEGEFRIEYGVFIRKKRYIPLERIQTIDVTSGLIQRMFRVVKLQLQTAGGGAEAEAVLTAITEEEAERLQDIIQHSKVDEDEVVVEEKTPSTYHLSQKELLLAATTSGGIGIVLSGFIALFTQVDDLIPYDTIFEGVNKWFQVNLIVYAILFSIVFLVIAWLIGMLIVVLRYANFSLTKREQELIVTQGFFEKRKLTIPLKRIQAVRLVENPVRQFLGYATVVLETAGGSAEDKSEGFSTVLFPLIKREGFERKLAEFIPEFDGEMDINSIPHRSLIRYMLRATLPVLLLVIPLTYFFDTRGAWSVILIPIMMLIGYLRYRDAAVGFREGEEHLVLRYRFISRVTVIMKKKRVQAMEQQQSFFQKRRSLSTIQASIKSSVAGKHFKVVDVSEGQGEEIYKWYSSQGQQKEKDA